MSQVFPLHMILVKFFPLLLPTNHYKKKYFDLILNTQESLKVVAYKGRLLFDI